uniref:DUF4794 domain-containing protein n=1 Tax=Glossina brevipalpis TaxID=37001 RepID=A0A1A9WC33_9MUSC
MKLYTLCIVISCFIYLSAEKPSSGKYSPYLYKSPLKLPKALMHPPKKLKALVVQIRSDHPVPIVLKSRPRLGHAHSHSHVHHHINPATMQHIRGYRPMKLTGPVYTKNSALFYKPLKLKLSNSKLKSKVKPVHKPATSYDVPFKYETPNKEIYSTKDIQTLPLESHPTFISDHFVPIHTIPAPNLAIQDNHIPQVDEITSTQPLLEAQITHQNQNAYQVVEDNTNDKTIVDSLTGSQKLYAPDPDPSLPVTHIEPATEPFNRPSISKPLPVDVQSNHLPVAQPLVQILAIDSAKQFIPNVYPLQYVQQHQQQQQQQNQLQGSLQSTVAPVHAVPVPIYNPTYLVTQSNHLYNQHRQQLFKPVSALNAPSDLGYVNADMTQEIASDGQILQAAKDNNNNLQTIWNTAPQYAALIAAPALDNEQDVEKASFQLHNVAQPTTNSNFITRLQKRSNNLVKGTVEDVNNIQRTEGEHQQEDDLYEVSSSMDVSNGESATIKTKPNKS